MFIKTHPADLIDGFGIENDETDELEMVFEDHGVFAVIRELPIASSRFWLFEIGAWDDSDASEIVCRSTPFVPLGDNVDDAAKLVELMITHVTTDHNLPAWKRGEVKSFGIENGNMLTGQKWTEYAEFGDAPLTDTEPYWPSVEAIKSNGMEN